MGTVSDKQNLEDDNNEYSNIIKYAPHLEDINEVSKIEKNNNQSSFIQTNSKFETNNLIQNINEPEQELNQQNILKNLNKKTIETNVEEINKISEINTDEQDEIDNLNYPETLLKIINIIRTQPQLYAEKVDYAVRYIKIENQIINDKITGQKQTIEKPIFKKKVKVALNKGESVFYETSKRLREMISIPPLEMNNNLLINLPNTKKEIYDNKYLIKQAEKIKQKSSLEFFYKDLIKEPNISALLMVVDDTEKNDFKKRDIILNPDLKYVGINCRYIGKTFVAYLGFSK
jgi:hypothetical protein